MANSRIKRKDVLAALARAPKQGDYQWDGKDEDDRPASAQELRGRRLGRPRIANPKVLVSMRLDPQVIEGFKQRAAASGKGYQTLMQEVLADALK